MLDYAIFSYSFKEEYVFTSQDENSPYSCLMLNIRKDLGLPAGSRSIDYDDDDNVLTDVLYHPFEDLPSSHSTMALKCYDRSHYGQPSIVIKASPAKLMQGHNVFGDDSENCIEQAFIEMHGLLCKAYPKLINYLDMDSVQVRRLDCTYHARVSHEGLALKVLDYLRDVGNGQRQPRRGDCTYATTVYWGGSNSKLIRAKAYGKHEEIRGLYLTLKKKAEKGCAISAKQVSTIEQLDLVNFTKGMIRFEATVLHEKLTRSAIPTNVYQLINYHKENPTLLKDLWHMTFDLIFDALRGDTMHYANDDELLEHFRTKLVTITAKGHKRYTKANNAFNFYCQLREFGLKDVRKRYLKSPNSNQVTATFYDRMKVLVDEMGFSKSHLHNLSKDKKGSIIPLIQMVNVDFGSQVPPAYIPPVSQFAKPQLRVA